MCHSLAEASVPLTFEIHKILKELFKKIYFSTSVNILALDSDSVEGKILFSNSKVTFTLPDEKEKVLTNISSDYKTIE